MRRSIHSRRSHYWHMGILLLIYSCINVYSALKSDGVQEDAVFDNNDFSTKHPYSDHTEYDGENLGSSSTTETPATNAHSTTPLPLTTEKSKIKFHRERRLNCSPPAIEQFPKPLMSPNVRKHGGLIIHVLVAVFTFLGLAIVCDDYFVSSLDRICEELKLSPDVAGATFMAAGSSAPELATVIIGVFFAKDDIGVSGVIGSAVFNIMFVISVCALCTGTVCQLNWWPLVRDCFFYAASILIMLFVIINDSISWVEALIMLLSYVVYCIALHFNTALERWAHSLNLPIKLPSKEEQSSLVTYKNIPDTTYTQGQPKEVTSPQPQIQESNVDQGYNAYMDPNSSWDPNAAWEDTSGATTQPIAPPVANSWGGYNTNTTTNVGWDVGGLGGATATDSWNSDGQKNYGYNSTGDTTDPVKQNLQQVSSTQPQQTAQQAKGSEFYKSKDIKSADIVNPLDKPVDGGIIAQISWGIVYPIHYMCRLTMPDCRTEKYKNWYPFTFLVSMIWISFYSYFMVWMITIIGTTLGIPDTVMGLTFVAAGVSVPDALSSIAVIKEGYGDMAVSNAVGSNVFDILICLGLPWFIQTAMIDPGSHVHVISKGLAYSTLSLLSTVAFLLVATHLNGWKLDRKLGIVLMFWYILFITVASLYELNVFGQLNPPECLSIY